MGLTHKMGHKRMSAKIDITIVEKAMGLKHKMGHIQDGLYSFIKLL